MDEGCFEGIFVVAFWVVVAAAVAWLAVVAGGAVAGVGLAVGFGESVFRFGRAFVSRFWRRVDAPVLAIVDDEPAALGYFFGPGFLDVQSAIDEGERGRGLAAARFSTGAAPDGLAKYVVIVWNAGGILGAALGGILSRLIFQVPPLVVLVVCGGVAFVTRGAARLGQRGLTLLRRVGYSCSSAGCYARGQEPVYACPSCGARHERLWPNRYGVFSHSCRCGAHLPTLAVLGRNTLAASCRACGGSLQGGDTSDAHVVIVGAAGSRRTHTALGFIDALTAAGEGSPGLEPANPAELATYRASALGGEISSARPEITVLSHVGEGLDTGHSVYVYDASAEFDEAEAAEQAFYDHIDAIALTVGAAQVGPVSVRSGSDAAAPELDELYARVLKTFDTHSGQSAASIRAARMGVVLTGACSMLDAAIAARPDSPGDGTSSAAIRQWLSDSGQGNFVRLLESDFKQVRYYAAREAGIGTTSSRTTHSEIVGWLLGGRGFSKWGSS